MLPKLVSNLIPQSKNKDPFVKTLKMYNKMKNEFDNYHKIPRSINVLKQKKLPINV